MDARLSPFLPSTRGVKCSRVFPWRFSRSGSGNRIDKSVPDSGGDRHSARQSNHARLQRRGVPPGSYGGPQKSCALVVLIGVDLGAAPGRCPVTGSVLRARVPVAAVDVTQIPTFAWRNQPAASHARDTAARNLDGESPAAAAYAHVRTVPASSKPALAPWPVPGIPECKSGAAPFEERRSGRTPDTYAHSSGRETAECGVAPPPGEPWECPPSIVFLPVQTFSREKVRGCSGLFRF